MSAKGTVGLLILTMVLGVLMDNIDASIVNVALPTIAADFHTDTSSVSWVSIAYSLMMAGLIIPFGRIADAGRIRVVFIAGFAVFTVFSVFCAMSTSLSLLVVSRIFQGIGAAAIVAVAPMICVKLLPREHLGRSLGIMAIASSTGFALGPALGGVLVQYLSWHWIFLINIPLGIACILLGRASLPREEVSKGALDVRGSFLLFVTVAAMVIAVESISDPDEMWIAVIAGIVAVLFLVGYIRESTHASRPLFDLSLFRLRDMDLALIAYLLLNLVYMGVLYVLPFYMDIELGLSSIMSGFILLLPSVLVIIMSIPVGNYTDHRGRRSCAIAASFFTLVYNVMFFLMEPEMGLLPLVVASLTMGIVWGVSGSACTGRVVDNIPEGSKAIGSSMMNFMNYMGGTVGTALFASLLTIGSGSAGVSIENLTQEAFMDGMGFAMLWGGVLLAAIGLIAAVLVRDRRRRDASGKG